MPPSTCAQQAPLTRALPPPLEPSPPSPSPARLPAALGTLPCVLACCMAPTPGTLAVARSGALWT